MKTISRQTLVLLILTAQSVAAVADEVGDLISDLKDKDPSIRVEAALALGEMQGPTAVDLLLCAPLKTRTLLSERGQKRPSMR